MPLVDSNRLYLGIPVLCMGEDMIVMTRGEVNVVCVPLIVVVLLFRLVMDCVSLGVRWLSAVCLSIIKC